MQWAIILNFILLSLVGAADLPPQIQKCHLSDPNMDHCITVAMRKALKENLNGFPEFGIPTMDPLNIPKMKIGAGTGTVKFDQNYKDVDLIGLSTSTLKNAHMDFENKILSFSFYCPEAIMKGKYNLNGKILLLPVHGDGKFTLTLSNGTYDHKITFKETEKDGEIYFKIKTYNLKMKFQRIKYIYENLFNSNKLLSDNAHAVVNDNWEEVYLDVEEEYEKGLAAAFKKHAAKFFKKIPINKMFPK